MYAVSSVAFTRDVDISQSVDQNPVSLKLLSKGDGLHLPFVKRFGQRLVNLGGLLHDKPLRRGVVSETTIIPASRP